MGEESLTVAKRDELEIAPNLWAGIGLVRSGGFKGVTSLR